MFLGLACKGGGSSAGTADVTFGVSDAPVGDLDSVTITIESMTVRQSGEDDVVIETFDDDGTEVERIQINLLDYQGSDSKIILEAFELQVGEYTDLRLEILDEDINASYVIESGDSAKKELKTPSDELKLGGFEVKDANGGPQTFIIEFNLLRSMTYNPGPDRYILKPRGVRIVDVESAALIRGSATAELLADCDGENDDHANRVYLYEGHGLDADDLGDVHDPDVIDPGDSIEPFASDTLDDAGEYEIGFVPSGDYTLAFSCDAAPDDSVMLDGIAIPAPANQLIEIVLEAGDARDCEFALAGVNCT